MNYISGFVSRDDGGSDMGRGAPGWAGRECDSCRKEPRSVYCRADEAYLCAGCDARVHAANRVASRHERVWVCESCERAPAAITCRADAAALCAACDADVHSANPLARRHQRVPVLPVPPVGIGLLQPFLKAEPSGRKLKMDSYDGDAASRFSSNQNNAGSSFYGEVDEYLDLVEYNPCNDFRYEEQQQLPHQQRQQSQRRDEGTEHLVPCHSLAVHEQQFLHHQQQQQQQQQQSYDLGVEYEVSSSGFNRTASLSHSMSIASMNMSVVPRNAMTEISNSQYGASKEVVDLFAEELPGQLAAMGREAKVKRYREKKKARRFEKTIRYALRKAYAENRPRIKGRFVKRSDSELEEVDKIFSTSSVLSEASYDIVPSF